MMKRLGLVSLRYGMWGEMPLNLLYLDAWVRAHVPDWEVRIIDGLWEEPIDVVLREHCDVVGISAMTTGYEKATQLAHDIKKHRDVPVLIGGIHISTCPESRRAVFDAQVIGEGELRLESYLKTGVVNNNGVPRVDLRHYPDLDYGKLDRRYYQPRLHMTWHRQVVNGFLLSSRGCPYRCPFCLTSLHWGGYRVHPAEWTVRQMETMADLGCDAVACWDDLFTIQKSRLREIAALFRARGLGQQIKRVAVQARANVIDDETCEILRSMNVGLVSFGFESGSQPVLDFLKGKTVTVRQNYDALRIVRRNGMQVTGSLMVGNPGETIMDILRTCWFALWFTLRGGSDILTIASAPYPGTEFWKIALAKGRVRGDPRFDFDSLKLSLRSPGRGLMTDLSRWQWVLMFWMAFLSTAPSKAKKFWECGWHWLWRWSG